MNKDLSTEAHLYDGTKQLPGTLELHETGLAFIFDDFKHSHINLKILFSEIEYARVFLVFGIADKGLKIASTGGKIDLFILDKSREVCDAIKRRMEKIR